MPNENWKNIAIRKEYYLMIEERAKENRRSVAGELEKILIDARIIKPVKRGFRDG
ncbi:MAG: hypothetical protein QW698_07545 [Nitrososphaerales archaeon]